METIKLDKSIICRSSPEYPRIAIIYSTHAWVDSDGLRMRGGNGSISNYEHSDMCVYRHGTSEASTSFKVFD